MRTKNYPKIDETIYTETLDNGLKVCLLPKQNVSEVNAFFTTKYGANDISFTPLGESEAIQSPYGVAHFLEHKMFDKGDYDAFERFSELGANANAYTNPTKRLTYSIQPKMRLNVWNGCSILSKTLSSPRKRWKKRKASSLKKHKCMKITLTKNYSWKHLGRCSKIILSNMKCSERLSRSIALQKMIY